MAKKKRPGGDPRRRNPVPQPDDPWGSPAATEWVRHVLTEMVPKMEGSAVVAQLVPEGGEGDVKFWVELGAAIMMDKPMIPILLGGRDMPPKLRAIADEIVEAPDGINEEVSRRLADAMHRVLAKREGGA